MISDKIQLPHPVKALSIREPFASLVLQGKVETRRWDTSHRGTVLICASQRAFKPSEVLKIAGPWNYQRILHYVGPDWGKLCGQAIGVARLVNTWKMTPEDEEATFARYHAGLYCHEYAGVKAINPFPFKGQVRWTNLTQEQVAQIELPLFEFPNDLDYWY